MFYVISPIPCMFQQISENYVIGEKPKKEGRKRKMWSKKSNYEIILTQNNQFEI